LQCLGPRNIDGHTPVCPRIDGDTHVAGDVELVVRESQLDFFALQHMKQNGLRSEVAHD